MASSLKIWSHNIKGVNIPEKRSHLLRTLRQNNVNIAFLQETHFRSDNIPKLHDRKYTQVFHATVHDSKTKGVSILISRDTKIKINDNIVDPEGRYIFLKGTLGSRPITLANVYFPNKGQAPFMYTVCKALEKFTHGLLILGGDFNTTLNPLIDSSSGTSNIPFRTIKRMKGDLINLTLHDSWRTLYPKLKDYTFFSHPHTRYSRIDYLFLSQKDLTYLYKASIEPMILSDHHPITMTLRFPESENRHKIWRYNPMTLPDQVQVAAFQDIIAQYFSNNDTPETNPMMQWEAHKCVIRGELIALQTKLKKQHQAKINDLLQQVKRLESTHKLSRAADTLQELTDTRTQLLELMGKQYRRRMTLANKTFYEQGNKSGHLLAMALKPHTTTSTVHCIKDKSGTSHNSTEAIAEQFQAYYTELYNLKSTTNTQMSLSTRATCIQDFLQLNKSSTVPEDVAQQLELPLTLDEMDNALKQMKVGKSPGPDGFSVPYYKSFTKILLPRFLKAFNLVSQESQRVGEIQEHTPSRHPHSSALLQAHITVLPKGDKDPTQTSNYRPISLLNVDVKLYAKALSNRLLGVLPSLVSLDQVGFVPGREARDNTIKAIHIHHWLTKRNQPGFFLSMDAEKAFDRVAWDYMFRTLSCLGFKNNFCAMVQLLYSDPSARVKVNGYLSNPFQIQNGTRQGCPLSPLLYVLTLEPFLRSLRNNPDIKGIHIKDKEYKTAAFADDILLFLSNPLITLPILLGELQRFNVISNLKINYNKSVALNITMPQEMEQNCGKNFPFIWEKKAITYLGIKIPKALSQLYELNHLPLLRSIQALIQSWKVPMLSWFGRGATLKMMILPKLLYMFQAIPIHLPPSYFATIRQTFSKFIWKSSPARVNLTQLTKPKHLGGIGLPDLKKYYLACIATRIVDWHIHSAQKDWVSLEEQFVEGPIHAVPWNRSQHTAKILSSHPLLQPISRHLPNLCKHFKIPPGKSPLMPLNSNPTFLPGIPRTFMTETWPHEKILATHFFTDGKFLDRDQLPQKPDSKPIPQWLYLQIRHFLNAKESRESYSRNLTFFESLCIREPPQRHLISTLYSMMFTSTLPNDDLAAKAWEQELNKTFSTEEWESINNLIHSASRNVMTQENGFKIRSRWYRTPVVLHKIFPQTSDRCWRCDQNTGSLLHIWWSCPILSEYWKGVHNITTKVTGHALEFDPACLLLHHTQGSPDAYRKSTAIHMINAAKLCIPQRWKNTSPPTLRDWLLKIEKISEMEELVHIAQERYTTYMKTWATWILYKTTPEYLQIITNA